MTVIEASVELMKYGGIELKKNYQKFLTRALIIAAVLHVVILGAFWVAQHWGESEQKAMPMVRMKLSDLAPPPSLQQNMQELPAVATPVAKPNIGVPVPVPDAEVSPEQTFATLNQITQAGPQGDSTGVGTGGISAVPNPIEVPKQEEQTDEDPYAFVDVEKEPEPISNLQSLVKYPELARKAGLEGVVFLRFQVLKDGSVGKVIVEKSDQKIFEQAAIDAVKSCKFTPAIQNKQPIDVWTSQRIEFKLR
ncbi:MAG TPA: TonB family protein [Candidatus Kapabacteria bacterium]|nr:TonB family protein [Candidatus Kapabacteria bacterium]